MGIYYQNIGANKSIEYNSNPYFYCPEALKALKEKPDDKWNLMGKGDQPHSEPVGFGENKRKFISETDEQTPEGMVRTTKVLFFKADNEHRPECKCGLKMEKRYLVWYKYTDPKAKLVGGMFRMAEKDKTYWTRYFRTRKSREKFFNNFVAKHKK